MVLLFCAVTFMVMVLSPAFRVIGSDAAPDNTGSVPLTSIVAFGSVVVGVTVIEVTPFTTLEI